MDDTANVGEYTIESEVRRGVRRRVEVALDDFARSEIDNYHIVSLHVVIRDARGLDDDETLLTVDARDVAPREDYKTLLDQI